MGVLKKGKHKFNYNEVIFYWYVSDWDLGEDYPLHIMSEDKTIQLRYGSEYYGLYQNVNPPKILVTKSNKVKVGEYPFALELDHSGVTPSNIKKILDWYFTTALGR